MRLQEYHELSEKEQFKANLESLQKLLDGLYGIKPKVEKVTNWKEEIR